MSSTKLSFYRPDLDGLRGIAVLLVVFFHYFPDYFWGGFIGVDIFFVISGFLISSILFRGAESGQLKITEFYSRRFRRIFPALIVVLVATYALGWVLLLADEYKQLGKHMAGAGGFISNFVLWREAGYFSIPNDHKPLMHLWSLGIEEQFYLCWPLLLFLGRRMRIPLLRMILVLSVVSFALNLDWIIADDTADFFSPASRAWELLIGALIARLITWKDRLPAYALEAGAIAGFLLIGLAEIVLARLRRGSAYFYRSFDPASPALADAPEPGGARTPQLSDLSLALSPHVFREDPRPLERVLQLRAPCPLPAGRMGHLSLCREADSIRRADQHRPSCLGVGARQPRRRGHLQFRRNPFPHEKPWRHARIRLESSASFTGMQALALGNCRNLFREHAGQRSGGRSHRRLSRPQRAQDF